MHLAFINGDDMKKNSLIPFIFTISLLLLPCISFSMEGLKRARQENNVAQTISSKKQDYLAALDAGLLRVDPLTGDTVLHCAAQEGNAILFKELLSRGGNLSLCNRALETPLHIAVRENYPDIVQQCIDGMPKEARRARICAVLHVFKMFPLPKDVQKSILAYLPELTIAYPKLCKMLVPAYITEEQFIAAQTTPLCTLLSKINAQNLTAYDIAKNHRNNFMARMTNPIKKVASRKEELHGFFQKPPSPENKEN